MFLKKNKKKSLVTQEDLNSRLVSANQALMQQMEEQQRRDTAQTMERQKERRKYSGNRRYYVRLWGGADSFCW